MENREVFHQSVLQINRQINFREKTTFGIQFNPDTGPKPAGAKRPVFEQPDGIGVERPVRGEQGHKPGRCLKIYGVIEYGEHAAGKETFVKRLPQMAAQLRRAQKLILFYVSHGSLRRFADLKADRNCQS